MAKEKRPYDSIIDSILDDREPNWKDLNLKAEKDSGEEVKDWSHQYADKDWLDDLTESASHQTPVPPSKSASTYEERIAEKEAAAPRINSVTAYRRENEYKSEVGDDASLMNEVTESIESAHKNNNLAENSAEKKSISDAQVQKYVRDLLNQGVSPAKVASKLQKLAEIELFNHQLATDYLQRNAGLMGLAYLEPNTYMDKSSPTYEHTAGKTAYDKPQPNCPRTEKNRCDDSDSEQCSGGGADAPCDCKSCHTGKKQASSNACVSQKKAWDNAGIKPMARSVKQVQACEGCTYFKKTTGSKTCALYHLPVVSNTKELSQIVNHLTAGVPEKRKHAALVQIANGVDRQVANPKVAEQTNVVKAADAKVANQQKRASYQFNDVREVSKHFESDHVAKMHQKGASLKQIYKWAEEKFGSVDTSIAFRGFVNTLKKNAKDKIVVASGDLSFLNSIGIRNAAFEGKEKCASCDFHKKALSPILDYAEDSVDIKPCVNCGADQRDFNYDEHNEVFCESCGEIQPISVQDLMAYQQSGKTSSKAPRVAQKFVESSQRIAAGQQSKKAGVIVTASKVRTLHQAGHSVEKIYKSAASKVGSVEARKAVVGFVEDMKKRPGKIAVSESDRAFLVGKLSFKPEQVRMLDPQRRPVTQVVASVPDDQHLLSYPGMGKNANEKKATDGHAILAEFDLTGNKDMSDIDISGPKRDDVEMNDHFKVDVN